VATHPVIGLDNPTERRMDDRRPSRMFLISPPGDGMEIRGETNVTGPRVLADSPPGEEDSWCKQLGGVYSPEGLFRRSTVV